MKIPPKFLDLMVIEIEHFNTCKDWSRQCPRCNKLIQDLNGLKLK